MKIMSTTKPRKIGEKKQKKEQKKGVSSKDGCNANQYEIKKIRIMFKEKKDKK
jgi:hypothetical protein